MGNIKRASPLLMLLVLAASLSPSPQQDPHAGQPDTCDNHFTTAPAARCTCHRTNTCPQPGEPPLGEDIKCKVYCRKDHCHCVASCDT